MAETLRDGALGDAETATRFVGRILDQCARLQALLEDLLTLSRLESPLGAHEPAAGGAGRAGQPRRRGDRPRRPPSATSTLEVERRPRRRSPGDADALERLLLNLLDNAVKYNRPGGTVRLDIRRDGEQVTIEVRDTGIGIPAEHLPRIFERFYRVDRAALARRGRHRAGPGHRQARGAAPRRQRRGGERAGQGLDVPRRAAGDVLVACGATAAAHSKPEDES